MNLCKHPNLLTVKGSFVVDQKLWIITPYLRFGIVLSSPFIVEERFVLVMISSK